MKYVVLGGTGLMGRIAVKDLFETDKIAEILIASHDLKKAKRLAQSYRSSRVKYAKFDAHNIKETARLLKNSVCAINCVQYELNLHIMRACLMAKTNYVDLGGLFHMTKKQLKLHNQFKKINKTAILGIGAAPGVVNVMARFAADKLDKVHEIHIRVGSVDKSKIIRDSPLSSSYSLQTIFEEFSYKPAVFTKGKIKFIDPMSSFELVKFSKPVNEQKTMSTLHSEIATLPSSFKDKGIREVSFKIAFDDEFVQKVKFLKELGILSDKPILVNKTKIIPRDFLIEIIKKLPKPIFGRLDQYEILQVIVKGLKNNKKKTYIVECHTKGMPRWNIGLDIDTGAPPSIAAQLIAKGLIKEKGVLAPEHCIDPRIFFKELMKRKMKIIFANETV